MNDILSTFQPRETLITVKPGFHYTANATTTTQKQSDYKAEQSSFTLISLFWLEMGRCRGRNWLNGNQAQQATEVNPFCLNRIMLHLPVLP